MESTQIRLTIPDSVDQLMLLGSADSLLKRIEESSAALISVRGKSIYLSGTASEIERLTYVFSHLIQMVEDKVNPSLEDVEILLGNSQQELRSQSTHPQTLFVTHKGKAIQPKTKGQVHYTNAISQHAITFGIGPAGTGKTYLAMAMALSALTAQKVHRIVLVRPVVEAGESLGFLPGTLQEKLDPYIRPLYDALFDMTSIEYANNLIEQGTIEVASLAFMRGRTLNDAFVILDEAQNTTPEQMKMFLTRLGFSSKFVITGDATQRDLVGKSGLDVARQVLQNLDEVAFVDLQRNDIVRHTLVGKIVDAYTAYEQNC
ncbi:MAG: PhoH family protein [Atopobiaceae bacterium]|nr:PhoH family protein [Atopobiaceae bacterium]